MRWHRVAWWVLVAGTSSFGVLMSCVTVEASLLATLLLYGSALGLLLPTARRQGRDARGPAHTVQPSYPRQALRWAALLSLGSVTAVGLVISLGLASTVALAAVVAAGSPAVLGRHLAAGAPSSGLPVPLPLPGADGHGPEPVTRHTGQAALRALTTPELCRAWRTTYPELGRPGTVERRARLVDARRQYLDEMERRDPAAFDRWLHAGARAASDPARYLGVGRRRPHAGP